MFSIRRKAKHRADFEKANCLLEDKYYTFNLRQDDVIVSKWHVYKYQGLWLEDGKDHTFLLSIPYVLISNYDAHVFQPYYAIPERRLDLPSSLH